ncbi:MAG: hypothetical protein R3B82_22400 [Sandaracinaceae bacterium]
MRRVIQAGLLLSVVLTGCGDEVAPSTEGLGAPVVDPPPRRPPATSIYDAEGILRESDTVVAGLTLPMGLEADESLSSERRHVYHSSEPNQAFLRYFGPRLNTLQIEHEGERVTYQNATPQGVRGGVVHLDVTIEPTPAHPSRVEIYERPPPPAEGVTISEDAIRRHLDTLQPDRRE